MECTKQVPRRVQRALSNRRPRPLARASEKSWAAFVIRRARSMPAGALFPPSTADPDRGTVQEMPDSLTVATG